MFPSPPEHREAGFTLIEVMVAFAILAVSLGALLPQFSLALGSVGRLEHRERATLIAEARLDALGTEFPLQPGEIEGETEDGYTWRAVICCAPSGDAPPPPMPVHLYQVTLSVTWMEAGKPAEIHLQTERLGWK
jgi:general secretion pathway protein I